MDEFQPLEDLVDEVLDVLVRELVLGVDDLVQICLHEVEDYVNIFKRVTDRTWSEIHKPTDIFVLEVAKEFYLTQDAFAIDQVLKSTLDLLDCHFLVVSILVHRRTHDSVGTSSERFQWLVSCVNHELALIHHE